MAQTQLIFDQGHYQRLIEARGDFIRRLVTEFKTLGLKTALDAGCGVGFFARILEECGLAVRAFDGRKENVEEARRRYQQILFEQGDIQDPGILRLGSFDLVLCFGLLYHLENPLLAIRHLRALTGRALLLESMCLSDEKPWMLLRDEPALEDQSLSDVAFYPSEGCIVKMLYHAGFSAVYRVAKLPDHVDFRDTPEQARRRTVLFASPVPVSLPGFIPFPEPRETKDPWTKKSGSALTLSRRIQRFASKPAREKYSSVAQRFRRWFPKVPVPLRLPFGAWFLVKDSTVDHALLCGGFENAEIRFVDRFLRMGMTVLDIGAHHGLYTLLASKRIGADGKVVAFEPSPRERRRLERHVRINFRSNVCIEGLALGSEHSKANLFLVEGGEDGCNSLRPPAVRAATRSVSVEVVTLDSYLEKAGIRQVDFMKLDVEGGELAVLRGAEKLLEHRPRPVILAEVQDIRTQPWGYRAGEIIRYLSDKGYKWFSLSAEGSMAPLDLGAETFDGNFVACPEESVSTVSLGNLN